MVLDILTAALEARKWSDTFKILKESYLKSRILKIE